MLVGVCALEILFVVSTTPPKAIAATVSQLPFELNFFTEPEVPAAKLIIGIRDFLFVVERYAVEKVGFLSAKGDACRHCI